MARLLPGTHQPMSEAPHPIEAEWQRALAEELRGNLLFDNAGGKTAFACGMAYAMKRLAPPTSRRKAWATLWAEAKAFVDAYMAEQAESAKRMDADRHTATPR